MGYSHAAGKATQRYKKKAYHRVGLDLKHEDYEAFKKAAASAGETVGGYIKKAAWQRLEREHNESENNEQLP